jgi:crotonobetainyl-CoA:carnitine CoA-transferase CaiB-like acyl-CoA transferase
MGALDGIRVIELANWAAVPSTGVLLAEEGAEVIKIEPPGGDSMRGLMHQAAIDGNDVDHPFQFSNRQKKSVAIDLTKDEGRELALDLIASADIVITNLLPARRVRLRLTTDEMTARNPTAVIGVLTGFGEAGPDADKPGYDLTSFFARSGLSASVAGLDGRPPRWRAAQGDHVAGLSLYAAIMTAMVRRASTGEGAVVETSLLQAAAWSNAYDLTRAAVDGRPARAKDRYGAVSVTSEAFLCGDGRYIQLSLAEPVKGWRIMSDVLALGELEYDERYRDPVQRFIHIAELVDLFDVEIAKHDSRELVDVITERGGAAAVVMQSHEVVDDPQIREVGILRPVAHAPADFDVVAPPFSTGDERATAEAIGAPGADTTTVLVDVLGLDYGTIDDLEARGAIYRPPSAS